MSSRFRPAAIFSDRMILQRGNPVPVWGEGEDGTAVTVRLRGAETAAAVKNGRWRVTLPPQDVGKPCELTVSDGTDTVTYSDVLFGDVWLAGGQSNMEWPLSEAKDGKSEIKTAKNTDIRHYYTPHCHLAEQLPEAEKGAGWAYCAGEGANNVSAVAYWFAKEIYAETGVPTGIIDCYWGGTSASCWMSAERLERLVSGKRYADDYRERGGNRPFTQAEGEWPPMASPYSPFRPYGLYETMFLRAAPYGIKGFIYYQGEEDWSRHADYFDWMCALIDQWREDFRDGSLPFLFVQLPRYDTSENIQNGLSGEEWPLLREAQMKVSRFVRDTGLAVTLDCGEIDDIHPTDKAPVGRRLALQALRKVYGRDIEADPPSFIRYERDGEALRLVFDKPVELRGGRNAFEIAGEDGRYGFAAAEASGNTVRVYSSSVREPRFVRYGWRAWCDAPLFGTNGLPVSSFRGAL